MAVDVQPGQWVTVKVKAEPRSEGARKTMRRLFRKDPKIVAERKRLSKSRPVRWHTRGGRPWADRPPQLTIEKTEPGAQYKLFASVDVLRDLGSVEEYVEVSPA